MSKEAMKWFGDQKIADAGLKSLLYVLAYEADKGTGECSTSQAVLAEKTGMTDRSVRSALVILERIEIIKRKQRSKGRYGRTTDLIVLALARKFDVSRATVKAIRKSLATALQPENSSGSAKISNRKIFPLQPENSSGEYNQGYQVPYQEEKLPTDSYGRGGTDTHATCDAGACETSSPDRGNPPTGQLIRFPARGAL